MGFSSQEYSSGLPFPPPGDPPDPVIEPTSLALAGRLFTIEPPGKSSAVQEISIKKRSEMTFILKQTENKEQLQGELLGKDGRTKKSSDTQQSEKKNHNNKIHQHALCQKHWKGQPRERREVPVWRKDVCFLTPPFSPGSVSAERHSC